MRNYQILTNPSIGELELKIDKFRELQTQIKTMERLKEKLSKEILELMGNETSAFDHSGNEIGKIVTRENSSLDKKMMERDFPGVLAQYTTVKESRFFKLTS